MEQFLSFDVAPFLACMNMIKINTLPIIYKMILTVLCDFKPSDCDSRNRTLRYIQILLEDQTDLADCLISFLPDDILTGSSSGTQTQTSDIINSSTGTCTDDCKWPKKEIKVRKSRKRKKVLAQAGQLLAQAASAHKSRASKSVTDPSSKLGKKTSGKLRSNGRIHNNPLEDKACVLIKPLHSSNLGSTSDAVLSQIVRKRLPVFEGSPLHRIENPELAQKRAMQLITPKQPYYSTSTAMYGATTTPSFRFQDGHGLNLGPCVTSMPLTYFPFICTSGEKPITTAEDYLASHVNDQKLSGPDIMSPFLKSAPTCTISQVTREEKSPRKSPRKHLSLSSKIQALKQTCAEVSSAHVQHKQGADTKPVGDKIRIQHTKSSTEVRGSQSPVFGSSSFNQNTKSYRNLSGFPYTHQLTFPDGQTQHLRIQGSGSSLVSPRNVKMNSATRLIGPDDLESSVVSPSQTKRKSSTASSSKKGDKNNEKRE
ncbi:hypothetical protein LOTGIDRAFT_232998 [Lottia gigantea]|uniref:Uncharacterized protein n=1 Tax=Lottia gigantea TaxID=225164 RepID=V3ZMD3_LOTGI|nr:hypothetical protein LOTGIDRAFT_232998 [Lottia gigantea]ESO92528.1 hypothetical protein LOTGIDRAFT_232998 [Lottia gigantea]